MKDSQLEQADRLERLILIMPLAMYWCVGVGQDDAVNHPTVLEEKFRHRTIPSIGVPESSIEAWYSSSNEGCAV